ncbi:MAG: OB-fold nucleic acid binding domain-containing protein, partial [Acidipropionibacterium jensenii]|nr:OB-fold nucleic acid binding domain-containing protein [Acidipropionibacterium jensenii]
RRVLYRVAASNDDLADDELRKESQNAGASTIANAQPRTRVRIQGRIEVLTLNPNGTNRWLEAELNDGTGSVHLVWMGRRRIPGLRAGRRLAVDGLIAIHDGQWTIYNPRYQLLSD